MFWCFVNIRKKACLLKRCVPEDDKENLYIVLSQEFLTLTCYVFRTYYIGLPSSPYQKWQRGWYMGFWRRLQLSRVQHNQKEESKDWLCMWKNNNENVQQVASQQSGSGIQKLKKLYHSGLKSKNVQLHQHAVLLASKAKINIFLNGVVA